MNLLYQGICGLIKDSSSLTNSFQRNKESENVSRSVMSDSLQSYGLWLTRLLCPWDYPVKNTGVGCHFLLHWIFLTQGSKLDLSNFREILYHLKHQGQVYILFSYWNTFKDGNVGSSGPAFLHSLWYLEIKVITFRETVNTFRIP